MTRYESHSRLPTHRCDSIGGAVKIDYLDLAINHSMYLITVPQNMYKYMLTKERRAHSKSVVYMYMDNKDLESTIENSSTPSIN